MRTDGQADRLEEDKSLYANLRIRLKSVLAGIWFVK